MIIVGELVLLARATETAVCLPHGGSRQLVALWKLS
jgi:hypothetical protein